MARVILSEPMTNDGRLDLLQTCLTARRAPGAVLVEVSSDGNVEVHAVGKRSAKGSRLIDAQTVFECASFSKPCFALTVLKLASAAAFPLDDPLQPYSPILRELGTAASKITARHVLSHTSGLPNFRSQAWPFRVWFPPGERFSYSSEGYVCLQQAVETITGKSIEQLARELVFEPLDMQRTSFVWQAHFEANHALPHNDGGAPEPKSKPELPDGAGSMHTTAADYGSFLRALLNGTLLEAEAEAEPWLAPVVAVPSTSPRSIEGAAPLHSLLRWGLGWGLIPDASLFFQWGSNPGFRALVVGSLKQRRAAAVFSNGNDGLRLAADTVLRIFPDAHPVQNWLGLS